MDLATIDYRQVLRDEADRYCARHSMKLTTLGKRVVSDHRFFENLADGAGCTVDTFQKFMKVFREEAGMGSPKKVLTRSNRINE